MQTRTLRKTGVVLVFLAWPFDPLPSPCFVAPESLTCTLVPTSQAVQRPPASKVALPIPLSPKGKKLRAVLDSLDVENHWLAGQHITHWKTGEADDKKGGPRTHCSLFVAAVCWKLDIPMLL